jgi:microcystin-dependent protein
MYLLMADTNVGYLWNAETNGALVFGTGGAERARITGAGKFGIGTNAPSHQLEVVGPASVTVGVSAGGSGFAELELVGQAGKNYITSDDTLSFDIGGTERATVATTGLNVTSGTLSQGGTAVSLSTHTHAYQPAGTYVTSVTGTAPITASTTTAGVVSVSLTATLPPTGSIVMWPTSTAPTDWLFLDGSTYSQSVYPSLAAIFGVTSGTFTLPDMRDRFAAGASTVAALANNAGTFAPNTANATAHDHTTNIAHGHADTIAVSQHSDHAHITDPAATASGAPSATFTLSYTGGATTATIPNSTHTHSTNIAATTSGFETTNLTHVVTGGVTSLGTTSVTSSSAGGTLTPKATLLNFIIKT